MTNSFVLIIYVCLSGVCFTLDQTYDTLYDCLQMESKLYDNVFNLKEGDVLITSCERI